MEENLYKLNEIREVQYYQLPKELFSNPFYKTLSSDAKITYSILLDRMELSRKNKWYNDKGEIFLILTRDELMTTLGVSKATATKIFKDLTEKKLIKEVRQGLNKPNLIFICHLQNESLEKVMLDNETQGNSMEEPIENIGNNGGINFKLQEVQPSEIGGINFKPLEEQNLNTNKTNINNTNLLNNILSNQSVFKHIEVPTETERKIRLDEKVENINNFVKNNISYNDLQIRYSNSEKNLSILDEITTTIIDVLASEQEEITIAKSRKPYSLVKSVFSKLDHSHIEYVIESLNNNTSNIGNIKQYLLSCLYNSYSTINNKYSQQVQFDMTQF